MNNRDKVKKYVTMFGMEAEDADLDTGLIEEEANRNEDYNYEENPINVDLGGDDNWGDDTNDDVPENEEGVTYEDKKITPDEELIQEEAKAANLVKLSGTHINGYVSNMVNILSSGLIERTGSFIANDYQASFIEPAEEIIAKCFAQDDTIKKFQEFRELLDQKSLMSKLAGTETTPFVYEGMQVTYLLALTAALSLVGTSLQINGTLPDTAKHIGFKAFNDILEAIDAILSVKSSLGTKIYYTDTVVDIDDNPQASLYVNIKEVNPSIGGVSSVPAGESIGNIIEIRNNGALMDYLLVMKALEKMSFIATKIEFKDITSKVLRAASDILSIDMQNDNGEEALATIVETVRNDIIAVLDSDDAITGEAPVEDGDNLDNPPNEGDDLPPDDGSLPDNVDDFNEDEVENIGSESLEITLNAIGQHFSDILHSKSFKIGVAVTGAYLLFNGIGKLCKYYVNKKIKENQDKTLEYADKICNLEIYPFSCAQPNLDKNSIGKKILRNSDLSRLGAYIVLRRIYKYLLKCDQSKTNNEEEPQKPVFVFRKYDRAWEELLKKIFKEVKVEDNFLKYLEDHFFYCQTGQQGGGITSGNVISVRDFKAWKNIYEKLKELAFTEISELLLRVDIDKVDSQKAGD